VAGQARVHGGQGREAGQGAIGLADRDGPVELHDRALGDKRKGVRAKIKKGNIKGDEILEMINGREKEWENKKKP